MYIVRQTAAANSPPPPRPRRQKWLDKLRSLLSGSMHVVVTQDHVLCILALRRGREAALGRDLFADPAWDILLELYAARLSGSRPAVSDLAKYLRIPETIAVRWVSVLAEQGLIVSCERAGGKGAALDLSPRAETLLKRLLEDWASEFCSI